MKNLYTTLFALLCFLSSTLATADNLVCSINSFSVSFENCDLDEIFLTLEIDAIDFGINGFTLDVNGTSYFYPNFDPNETYHIWGGIGTCDIDLIISITDQDNPSCTASYNYGPACCPCIFWEPLFEASDCIDGTFDMEIDLEEIYGSCDFYDWKIIVDGLDYVLGNSNNDNLWDALDITAADSLITFDLCSFAPMSPCETYTILNPCYVTPCSINSFTAQIDTSSCTGEIVGITFDFDAAGFGINGFTVTDGTSSEFYELGYNYTFYTNSACAQDIVLSILDEDNPDCIAFTDVQSICCPCQLIDITASTTSCVNDKFDIEVDLNIDSGTCLWYSWYASIEGENYVLDWNNNTLVAQDIMAVDSLLEFMICTTAPTGECFSLELVNPCYISSNSNCEITSFVAEYDSLSCIGELIDISFDFNAMDFGQNGFTVSDGVFTETYSVDSLYTFTTISDCTDSLNLIITDLSDTSCTDTLLLAPACCPCVISDPIVTTTTCVNDSFDINVNFALESGSCINYEWFTTIEGITYDLIWDGSSYVTKNISSMDSILSVSICTFSPTGECFDIEISNPCYSSPSFCSIESFTAQYDSLSCVGEIIMIQFDFDGIDFGQNGFTVNAGPAFQSYSIGDDYSIYVISECVDSILVSLTDNDDPSCTASVLLGPACCSCNISEPIITTTDCVDDVFDLEVDFTTESGSCVNYEWIVTVEGIEYDIIWNGSTLQAADIVAMDSLITVLLCTTAPTGECYTYIIENPCYVIPSNCVIDFFIAAYDTTECFAELIDVVFDFTATDFGQNGFTISDGSSTQTYNLNSNYTFYGISDCADSINITMTDLLDPTCSTSLLLGPACCPCIIADPDISTTDCIDDKFDILLDPDIVSGSCINADWEIIVDNEVYPLEIIGSDLVASDVMASDSLITVTLCTLSPTGECFDYIIENPCYVTTNTITVLSFGATIDSELCDENGNVKIDFNYDVINEGDLGFSISLYETVINTFTYGENIPSIVIPPLCGESTTFTFRDIEKPEGTADTTLEVCCETSSTKNVLLDYVSIKRIGTYNYGLTNNSSNDIKIGLHSITGQYISSYDLKASNQQEIDLQNYPAGVYLLWMTDDIGNSRIEKLIKI